MEGLGTKCVVHRVGANFARRRETRQPLLSPRWLTWCVNASPQRSIPTEEAETSNEARTSRPRRSSSPCACWLKSRANPGWTRQGW